MKLAVIPARGGSKRIPRKNVRLFHGQPMIAWSIETARASGCFDRIVVSTDCDDIAEIAQAFGAEVPFRRPPELADDFTPTIPVIRHAISALQAQGTAPSAVCCIYATAPFLHYRDLQAAFERLSICEAFVFAVTEYHSPIQRALRRDADGRVSMFSPEHFFTRSQDLEPAWHDAGQFYLANAQTWLSEDMVFKPGSIGISLPSSRVQDIDTLDDWERAELMFAVQQGCVDAEAL